MHPVSPSGGRIKEEDRNFNKITLTCFDDKPCLCAQYLPLEGELKREDFNDSKFCPFYCCNSKGQKKQMEKQALLLILAPLLP